MIYLLLCILSNLLIFIVFRLYPKLKINTIQAIVMNYFFCVITGLLFYSSTLNQYIRQVDRFPSWGYMAIFLSFAFILSFMIMARTTQKLGITVATIASKLSLVIPVAFSILFFTGGSSNFSVPYYIGLAFALVAIVLASLQPKDHKLKSFWTDRRVLILPLSVFLLGGMQDTLINWANLMFIPSGEYAVFVTFIFILALIWGILWLIKKQEKFQAMSILGGLMLGIPNFFSMIFLLRSLEAYDNNGALIYPLINIGIILGGALISVTIFKDKLMPINYLGVFLALVSLILISWANGYG
jgi:drug/metabolite transporter (DMT)-like permease